MAVITLAEKIEKMTLVDRLLIGIFLLGCILAITSLFRGIRSGGQAQIEYLGSGDDSAGNDSVLKIMVDIEGAVISPGVYELPIRSRLKDVLVVSGGYAVDADREYCEKNLNLAQEVKDGQKIYIPTLLDTPLNTGYAEAKSGKKMINLNTGTISELDTLWGVGLARAETIVKNRPYNSPEEVVSKGGMTQQLFDKNSEGIQLF